MKTCRVCKETKDLSCFNKSRLRPDGVQQLCKVCDNLRTRKWQQENWDRAKQTQQAWGAEQQSKNVNYRLKRALRSRLNSALRGKIKVGSAVSDVGCSIEQLKQWLENKFQPGMTWNNYGHKGWHVDHIKPLAAFDLTNEAELKQACHYTNLQPLWASDNLRKGARSMVK